MAQPYTCQGSRGEPGNLLLNPVRVATNWNLVVVTKQQSSATGRLHSHAYEVWFLPCVLLQPYENPQQFGVLVNYAKNQVVITSLSGLNMRGGGAQREPSIKVY